MKIKQTSFYGIQYDLQLQCLVMLFCCNKALLIKLFYKNKVCVPIVRRGALKVEKNS